MAISENIISFGNTSANYGAMVGQSLQQLGQQVGQTLAMREYQKQAAAQLPFISQQMQLATKEASEGKFGDAYSKIIGITSNPSVTQNPFILPALEMGMQAIKQGSSQAWFNLQNRQQGGGGATTATGLPRTFMTPQEQAESVLLGGGAPQGGGGMGGAAVVEEDVSTDGTVVDVGVSDMPQGDMEARFVDESAKDPASAVSLVAETAKTKGMRDWLKDAAKNPPEPQVQQDFKTFTEQYFAKTDAEKEDYFARNTRTFANKDEYTSALPPKTPNYFEVQNADKILGKGFRGVIMEPSVEAEKTTVGQRGQSATFGTNKAQIDGLAKGLDSSVQELNQGSLGRFISNSGGIYNLEKETEQGDTDKPKVFLVNKRNPDQRIQLQTPAQIAAFDVLNAFPGEIDRLNNRGAKAAFVSVGTPTSVGPTRAAEAAMIGSTVADRVRAKFGKKEQPAQAAPQSPMQFIGPMPGVR